MEGKEGNIKVSKLYKKAYNHADLICRYMPHKVKDLQKPKGEPSDYTRGFQDRIEQFNKDREKTKSFSVKDVQKKYAKELKVKAEQKSKNPNKSSKPKR